MFADYYVDLAARRSAQIAPPVLLGNLMQKLHPLFVQSAQEGSRIAVAFPDMGERFGIGGRLRLLAQHRQPLEKLLDRLVLDRRFDDYWIARQIKNVPPDINGHVAFVRYRISHALSAERAARHLRANTLNEINRKMRNKRLRCLAGKPAEMGFVDLDSSSTGQRFRMFVKKVEIHDILQADAEPDCYGLSRPTRIVPLPDFAS